MPVFALPSLSLSTISTTLLLALASKSAATLTSATRSLLISPELSLDVETKLAQPSASWLSGGSSQRQSMPQAAPGCPKLRPASANQPLGSRWPAIQAFVLDRESSVFSPDTKSAPVGASPLRPPGRTMVQSRPEARRYFSATSFASSTWPKALVILYPAESS